MAKKIGKPYGDVPSVPERDTLSIVQLINRESKSIELEIGFGKGRFLLDRAEKNPEVEIAGIETRRKWVHLVTERGLKRELSNVRVWFGDAKTVLPKIEENACLDRVFINFPDPWWKERHKKRMVVKKELIQEVARLLKDGGEIFVQTDVDFRAEYYLATLSSIKDLSPLKKNGVVDKNPYGAKSLREIRCEEIGLSIYRILFYRQPRN